MHQERFNCGTAGSLSGSGAGQGATAGSGPVPRAACGSGAAPAGRWGCRHRLRVPPEKTGSPSGPAVPAHPRGCGWMLRMQVGGGAATSQRNLSLLLIVAAPEPPQRCPPQPWGHPGWGCSSPRCRSTEEFEGRLRK